MKKKEDRKEQEKYRGWKFVEKNQNKISHSFNVYLPNPAKNHSTDL